MPKLCIIGAGSTTFTRHIVTDLLLKPEFKGLDVALMDIDTGRLEVTERVISAIAGQLGATGTVSAHTDRREALAGSDFVLTSIQVGGYRPSTVVDFEVPKRYGLRQTIADTLGIGGIMRGLRTIPVLLDIGRDIADQCPDALWLQYVNPMVMNMMAIHRELAGLKAVGLCHSVQGTAQMLAADLGEDFADIDFDCAGINHVAFFTRFEKRANGQAEDMYPRLREIARQVVAGERVSTRSEHKMDHGRALAEKVRYEMLLRLGYFVTESSEHFAEYVPWFIKRDRPDLLEKFEIPLDEYIDRCESSINRWEDLAGALDEESRIDTTASNEYASVIARAVVTGEEAMINGNVSNADGLIPNLPRGCCVEVPCVVGSSGIRPQRVEALPPHLAALMQTNVNVQELTVAAVLEGRREHVYHAAMLDPHTAAELSLEQVWNLVDELIEAHGDYIPASLRS